MALTTFTPNTVIQSAPVNANFTGLASGSLDSSNNSLIKTRKQAFQNFVATGLTIGTSATLSAVLAAGEAYVNGQWVSVSLQAISFTASKDNYLYLKDDGSLTNSSVTNNAASPTVVLNSDGTNALLIGIAIASGSAITTINQGDPAATVPTSVNVGGGGTEGHGVRIYPRDTHGILTFAAGTQLATDGDVLTMAIPFLTNYDLTINAHTSFLWTGTPAVPTFMTLILDGVNGPSTRVDAYINDGIVSIPSVWLKRVASGSHTLKLNVSEGGGGLQFNAATLMVIATPC